MSDATASTIASPMSSGSGGGGLEIDADPRVEGAHTSQAPHGARTPRRSARPPARAGTRASPRTRRSGRHVTRRRGSRGRGAPRRARASAGAAVRSMRIRRPSSKSRRSSPACSSMPTSTRASRSGTTRRARRVDEPAGVSQRAVDRAKLGRRRHVGDREAPSAVASLGLARRSVWLGSPSRPARPTIWTYPSSESG